MGQAAESAALGGRARGTRANRLKVASAQPETTLPGSAKDEMGDVPPWLSPSAVRRSRSRNLRAHCFLTVANPFAGMENCSFVVPMARVVVLAELPDLYMATTMWPFGFLTASASGLEPLVATRLAPGDDVLGDVAEDLVPPEPWVSPVWLPPLPEASQVVPVFQLPVALAADFWELRPNARRNDYHHRNLDHN